MKQIGNIRIIKTFTPMYFMRGKAKRFKNFKGKDIKFKTRLVCVAFLSTQPFKNKAYAKEVSAITIYM